MIDRMRYDYDDAQVKRLMKLPKPLRRDDLVLSFRRIRKDEQKRIKRLGYIHPQIAIELKQAADYWRRRLAEEDRHREGCMETVLRLRAEICRLTKELQEAE